MHMHTKGTIKLKKLKENSSTVKRLKFKTFVKKAKTVILSLVKCASYMIKLLLILCCVLGRHTLLNTEVSGIL